MRRILLALTAVLCMLAAIGCATAATATAPTITFSPGATAACPAGQSVMGCSLRGTTAAPLAQALAAPAGRTFPDVSSWQGCQLNWNGIAAPGAAVKADEYGQDACFAHNVASLRAAGKWWAPYLFVRSCSAAAFIATIRSVGGLTSGPAIIDEEVPAADGCTATLTAQIERAFGREPVEYTSPGTAPTGAAVGHLPLWVASYGVSRAPCLWRCPVAWQFTDGASVPRFFVAGLGYVDVSVDYGLLSMLPPKPKPKPAPRRLVCFGRSAQVHNATCERVRGQAGAESRQALALTAEARALHAKAAAIVKAWS
ncbi:MAG TPA: GH25 family lysozyme [Gemmatimonadales bacterium]|nr:GH25 family lysozyme [Gemmatimonadales bacterium]